MLLKILQKLNDRCPESNEQRCRTEISPSEDDKNYQEISNQFLCHPNTKQYTNSVYETDCMVMENFGVEQDDAGCVMTWLESKSNGSMLVNNDQNGVYELQKIIWIMSTNTCMSYLLINWLHSGNYTWTLLSQISEICNQEFVLTIEMNLFSNKLPWP